ncbi:N-acetylated-alpha-linked acidic dipeptidase 2-like [Tachypleus tridentatus]|uniref:N-acetylated-alpha-linked acidic dipeptidase 2-like n=1 Tax=Tachypleus tridentatus TaxID=6853 RepID=UPI003FD2A9D0
MSGKMAPKPVVVILFCVILVVFILGFLIGYYGISSGLTEEQAAKLQVIDLLSLSTYHPYDDATQRILKDVSPENIKSNLRYLTEQTHLAGTARDKELARYIRDTWKSQGLEKVHMVPYDILLSYPDKDKPNKVHIIDENERITFSSRNLEDPTAFPKDIIPAFNGYAPRGDVTALPVYVNYGTIEDFEELEKLGINVSGKICIARYGKIYRGNKVENAQIRGAVGVVLFSDPSEVARNGTEPQNVFPNSWWVPETAIQRGNIKLVKGDPVTPNYPSVDGAFRYKPEEVKLPRIPCQPIGYGDAQNILKLMDGQAVPDNWKGLLNITYRYGPGFKPESNARKLRLVVNNEYTSKIIYNVIGVIRGSVEPDRYVLVGNHLDAWTHGAIDPSSGTSQLLELTRVLGGLLMDGWRPRRTLVFGSWGAEEFGLSGSTEWVEEHIHKLGERAVAYINVDSCSGGSSFRAQASPKLASLLRSTSKMVPDPVNPQKTLYETWKSATTNETDAEPEVQILRSGSDHAPFAFYAGVPSINIKWGFDKKKTGVSMYPAYHTAFDTFDMQAKILDPKFTYHQNCAQFSGLLLHQLSGSVILPYNLRDYGVQLMRSLEEVKQKYIEKFKDNNVTLDFLQRAIRNFSFAADSWHKRLEDIDLTNPLAVRQANDQMMMIERIFIKPEGLPPRYFVRHVAFAPSKYDSYSNVGFPQLQDLMFALDPMDKEKQWQQIRRHISDLMIIIRAAADYLEETEII